MLSIDKVLTFQVATVGTSLHTADAPKIWIDQSGFSGQEKLYCPAFNVS